MRILTALALLLSASAPQPRSGEPVEPFRIIGNVYYVGASEIASYLIVTPKGHILIDGGYVENAPMIRASIEKLGFRVQDVKILLNSQAHFDHAGGLAELKQQTGATFMASEGDAPLLARGGADDPEFGNQFTFPPIVADHILHDRDRFELGGTVLTAVLTPGHTPGCTTWTMRIRENDETYRIVFVGGPTFPGYKLVDVKTYPNIVDDFRKTFATLKSLPCDVFLGAHGSYFNLKDKMRRNAGFVDPQGYSDAVAAWEKAFEREVRRQSYKS